MAIGNYVAYYRVSTQKQGQSGLGLEAQKSSVLSYLNGGQWELTEAFTEIETGKGADALDKRPQLKAAIDACRKSKATLIIAKLDRLARNVHFISGLLETGVDFVCADMPQANKVMLQMYSVMSEWERDQISARTKAALAAAKARGVVLGAAGPANLKPNIEERQQAAKAFAERLRGVVEGMKARGVSVRGMVDELNALGIKASRGGAWNATQVQRLLVKLGMNGAYNAYPIKPEEMEGKIPPDLGTYSPPPPYVSNPTPSKAILGASLPIASSSHSKLE